MLNVPGGPIVHNDTEFLTLSHEVMVRVGERIATPEMRLVL